MLPVLAETAANYGISPAEMARAFDERTQTFTANGGLRTPVFREYPASKVSTTEVDEAILELNASLWGQFAALDPGGRDPRGHYALVGATWLDRPERVSSFCRPSDVGTRRRERPVTSATMSVPKCSISASSADLMGGSAQMCSSKPSRAAIASGSASAGRCWGRARS